MNIYTDEEIFILLSNLHKMLEIPNYENGRKLHQKIGYLKEPKQFTI